MANVSVDEELEQLVALQRHESAIMKQSLKELEDTIIMEVDSRQPSPIPEHGDGDEDPEVVPVEKLLGAEDDPELVALLHEVESGAHATSDGAGAGAGATTQPGAVTEAKPPLPVLSPRTEVSMSDTDEEEAIASALAATSMTIQQARQTLRDHLSVDAKFFDTAFDVEDPFRVAGHSEGAVVRRVGDRLEHDGVLFDGEPTPDDIIEGQLGDCFFLAAVRYGGGRVGVIVCVCVCVDCGWVWNSQSCGVDLRVCGAAAVC